ncbi:MAG TPA: fumarylacetoacetate hydrolase family protein [Alphaproteobacteria bacterium]|nr:fumarylacetoacetate hydrolase family protein [Alphaproteobacteria bacterium]
MKLCRFDEDRLGVVIDDMVHDITDIQTEIRAGARYDMRGDAVIAALPEYRERMERAAENVPGKPVSDVALLPPVARPSKVMAAPVNYAAHVAEMAAQPHVTGADQGPKRPSGIQNQGIFLKANSALVGASEGVAIRFPDRRNDHEVEFCVIVGKQGSHVTQADALDYVAGYTLGLDMTVRGREDRSFRKSCDGYAPLGPWMVTADEIPEPNNVPFTVHLNGELKQDAHSKDMIFDIPRLIEFATEYYTIYPGDVLFTGSPPGVSEVKAGDEMRCNCDLIGEMTVKVRAAE